MYPGVYAQQKPDYPAIVNTSTGEQITYGELAIASSQIARTFRRFGLKPSDHFSVVMENNIDYFKIIWAAFIAGFTITTINRHLTAEEAAYIVQNSDSKILVCSANLDMSAKLGEIVRDYCGLQFSWGGAIDGFESLEDQIAEEPETLLPIDTHKGQAMPYSSGTTGRPKGVIRPPETGTIEEGLGIKDALMAFGFSEATRYLSPAPLYHAAPFTFCNGVLSIGGTIYMMERFDEEEALRCLQEYEITHSQWVPTMFIRMLKLPEAVRARYSFPAHQLAIHAAAPCPVEAKRSMIEWWGEILFEYYAGSEGNGITVIASADWLQHPGSVGCSMNAVIHICDDSGQELPAGQDGTIFFEPLDPAAIFSYHKDDDKTHDSRHPENPRWTTLGDIGHLDEEGYLYLTDRKAYMIISGGVNIYPQEIEDVLVMHDQIADVAVFSVPHEEFGEEVKAVVQLQDGRVPKGAEAESLAQELMAYSREKLAAFKVPRSVDFTAALPRLPTGKLYKRLLRDKYWEKPAAS